MMILRFFGRLLAVVILGILLLGGVEYVRGTRGPTPGPTPESAAEGRALLARVVDAHGGRWPFERTSAVRFSVEVETVRLAPSPRGLHLELDPRSRSAEFSLAERPGERYRYDAATEAVSRIDGAPMTGAPARVLPTLLPSIAFWALLPAAFDDTTAAVWRLPDRQGRARLAVRWPGEADWFLLDVDPASGRMAGLEFVDARFGAFFRWRGDYTGPAVLDGAPLPAAWRFRPASPVVDGLLGRRDLAVLRFGPVE